MCFLPSQLEILLSLVPKLLMNSLGTRLDASVDDRWMMGHRSISLSDQTICSSFPPPPSNSAPTLRSEVLSRSVSVKQLIYSLHCTATWPRDLPQILPSPEFWSWKFWSPGPKFSLKNMIRRLKNWSELKTRVLGLPSQYYKTVNQGRVHQGNSQRAWNILRRN